MVIGTGIVRGPRFSSSPSRSPAVRRSGQGADRHPGVVAAESEARRKGVPDTHLTGDVWDVVQVAQAGSGVS